MIIQPAAIIVCSWAESAWPTKIGCWRVHQALILVNEDLVDEGRDRGELLLDAGKWSGDQGAAVDFAGKGENLDVGPKGSLRTGRGPGATPVDARQFVGPSLAYADPSCRR